MAGSSMVHESKSAEALEQAIENFDVATQRYYRHMAHLNGCPFLVVEDDTDVREMLKRLLQAHNRKVDTAGTVAEAKAKLALRGKKGFATIILDMGLPDGSGVDVLRWLREQEWSVPVIVYTGMENAEKWIRAAIPGVTNVRVEMKGRTDVRRLAEQFGA